MWLSNYFQRWYLNRAGNIVIATYVYTDDLEISGKIPEWLWEYNVIRYSKAILIPLWSVVCLWGTFRLFYRRELEEPVDVLSKASERILGDDLDFTVESRSDNELGALCSSFETMRKNLYDSNYQLWKSLEERKRLNSAFSHDLRTPITVLKGYTELAEQLDGQLPPEKQQDMLRKMSGQIERLERYTEKMSGIHKLEDITFHIPDSGYMDTWTFTSSDGRFETTFVPVLDRAAKLDFKLLVSDQHQVFGRMSGRAVLDDGTPVEFRDLLCFAEKLFGECAHGALEA